MTRITSTRDEAELSMTLVAEFDAPPERVWNLWEDPRQLERWYGPEPYPAFFTRYEFEPGGQCRYTMTGPDDFVHHGWWRIDVVDASRRIEFVNGLAGEDGEPVPGLEPIAGTVMFEPIPTGTRMTLAMRFSDLEQMERLGLGMEEGTTTALRQLGALLLPVDTP